MNEGAPDPPDFNWRPLICAVVVSTLLPLLIDSASDDRTLMFGYYFLAIPLLCIILIVTGFSRDKPPWVFIGVISAVISVLGLITTSAIRPPLRWFFGSTHFKAQVLAQLENSNGELRHVVWDDNSITPDIFLTYLVYDPGDGLSGATQRALRGNLRGVPGSGVKDVKRLEKNWYALTFKENATWRSEPNVKLKRPETSRLTGD